MDITKLIADALQGIGSSALGVNLSTVGSAAVGLSNLLNNLSSAQKNRLESKLRKSDVEKMGVIARPTAEEIREFGTHYEEIKQKTRPPRRAAKKAAPRKKAAPARAKKTVHKRATAKAPSKKSVRPKRTRFLYSGGHRAAKKKR